ncbi:MAG: zinc-ribbon domain-containing protein [Dehalococcoidia bacterium]
MFCPNCEIAVDVDDSFCRRCGAPLSGAGLPVPATSAHPPVPWRNMALVLMQGAAALAVSTLAEMAVRAVVKRALRWPLSLGRPSAAERVAELSTEEYFVPIETHTESQTVLVRRVRIRQP